MKSYNPSRRFLLCLVFGLISGCGGGGGGGGAASTSSTSTLTFNPYSALSSLYKSSTATFTMTSGPAVLQQQYSQGAPEVVDGGTYSVSSMLQVLTVSGVQQSATTNKIYYVPSPFSIYLPIKNDASRGAKYPTTYSSVSIPTSAKVGDFGTYWTWVKANVPNTPAENELGIEQCHFCPTQTGTVTWTVEADTSDTVNFCFTNDSKFCYRIDSANKVIGKKITTSGITYQ